MLSWLSPPFHLHIHVPSPSVSQLSPQSHLNVHVPAQDQSIEQVDGGLRGRLGAQQVNAGAASLRRAAVAASHTFNTQQWPRTMTTGVRYVPDSTT